MPELFISSTPVWRGIERPRRAQRTRGEKATAGRITHVLMRGGVINMERLCSMSEKEIMAIRGINKATYRYVLEALEDLRAEYGDVSWEMPDLDAKEMQYILDELDCRKQSDYYRLVDHFRYMASDGYNHPEMKVMERLYFKLSSIYRDEFAAIMAEKNVNIDQYGI